MKDMFTLAERPFSSIQAEGKTIGKPSYFLRFFGCNYRCSYCDSSFTFNPETQLVKMGLDYLVQDIKDSKMTNIVITGGEPTLYLDKIVSLVNKLAEDDDAEYSFEIETNGSLELTKDFLNSLRDTGFEFLFNISPKLHYLDAETYELLKQNIRLLKFFHIDFIIKFVYEHTTLGLYKFTSNIFKLVNDFKSRIQEHIYVMPECRTREEHLNNFDATLNICKQFNLNFSPRLHILLWSDKKGV